MTPYLYDISVQSSNFSCKDKKYKKSQGIDAIVISKSAVFLKDWHIPLIPIPINFITTSIMNTKLNKQLPNQRSY